MARWTDLAEWRGPTVSVSGLMAEQRGCVLHIAAGYYEGTISWQKNPAAQVSSHFVVAGPRDLAKTGTPDGRIAQVVDTGTTAWTQRAGNGHWLSIECSGLAGDALSPAQIEACAQILARGHREYGYPLQIASGPSGRGLGHHSMGAENGVDWGHSECPGVKIKNQKPAILARAIQLAGGAAPIPTGDDDVDVTDIRAWTLETVQTVRRLEVKADAALTALGAIGTSNPDVATILAGVDKQLTGLKAEIRDAVADLGEGGAAQVRADG